AHVLNGYRIKLLNSLLDLLLVGMRMHLEGVRIQRRLLMRALLGNQRPDDDIYVVHDFLCAGRYENARLLMPGATPRSAAIPLWSGPPCDCGGYPTR